MFEKNSFLSVIKNIFIYLVLSICIGAFLITCVYSFSSEKARKNISESVSIHKYQNTSYYFLTPYVESSIIDNYTDSIMLNIAAFPKGNNFSEIIKNAFSNPRYQYYDLDPSESLIQEYSNNTNPDTTLNVKEYERYWHGYLVYLKPLLTFFNIYKIQCINMTFQFILLILTAIEIYKKAGYKLLFPFLVAIIILNPISSALCFQYSDMYYITLISVYLMLNKEIYKMHNYFYFFLFIGIITSFVDFLTYPLIGLGFNLIMLIVLNDNSFNENLKRIFIASITWFMGYIGMWSGKWFLSSIITKNNTVTNALYQINYRLFGDMQELSILDVIKNNLKALNCSHIIILLLIVFIYCLIISFNKKYYFKFDYNKNFALLLTALIPFIWFVIVQNHSAMHSWMTHKNLSFTICILLYIILSSYKKYSKV